MYVVLIATYSLQFLVRQTDTVLHPHFIVHATFLAKNGDSLNSNSVLDNAGSVLLDGDGSALHTSPRANAAAPANDGVQHQSVVLDLSVLQHNGLLHTCTAANSSTSSNGDIGSQLGGRVNVSTWVNVNRRDNVGRSRSKLVGTILPCLLQVQSIGRDGGSGRLDLTPKVLGLVHKELLAVGHITEDVLLEADDLVLGLVVIVILVEDVGALEILGAGVAGKAWSVGSTLDRTLNGREDDIGAEQIDTTVDEVGDVAFGLFDVVQNPLRVVVANNATEVCSGIVGDLGAQNDGFGVLLVEELQHLVERERAADVGVENEETLGLALEDGIAEMVQTTSGAEGLVFAQVLDGEVGVGNGRILDEVAEDGLVVVADQVDFLNGRDFGNSGQAVVDDWVAGDLEQWLVVLRYASAHRVRLRLQCFGMGQDGGVHTLGTSRDRGRKRVPRDAPPTCQSRQVSKLLIHHQYWRSCRALEGSPR